MRFPVWLLVLPACQPHHDVPTSCVGPEVDPRYADCQMVFGHEASLQVETGYDSCGRIARETTTRNFQVISDAFRTYRPDGRLTHEHDVIRPSHVRHRYDATGRLATSTLTVEREPTCVTTYRYPGDSRFHESVVRGCFGDETNVGTFQRRPDGQPEREAWRDGSSEPDLVAYDYDAEGRMIRADYAWRNGGRTRKEFGWDGDLVVFETHDPMNPPDEPLHESGWTLTYEYDDVGRRIRTIQEGDTQMTTVFQWTCPE